MREFFWDNERWRIQVSVFLGVGVTMFVAPQPPEALGGEFAEWFLATVSIGYWACVAFSIITMMVKPIKEKDRSLSSGDDTSVGASHSQP